MARNCPVLYLWPQNSHFTVYLFHIFTAISLFNQLLHSVLMQWAEGGSLDDYIDARLGRPTHLPHPTSHHDSTEDDDPSHEVHSRSARIRAFRAMQRAVPSERSALRAKLTDNGHSWTAVHLLSAEEVLGIFGAITAGLGFLVRFSFLKKKKKKPLQCIDCLRLQHDKSILHLDLKPGNVLLTWDEGALMYAYFHPLLSTSLTTYQPTRNAL